MTVSSISSCFVEYNRTYCILWNNFVRLVESIGKYIIVDKGSISCEVFSKSLFKAQSLLIVEQKINDLVWLRTYIHTNLK